MSEHEVMIFIAGAALGCAGSAILIILSMVVLTIKEKRDEIKHRQEHRLENLMMAETERLLDEREG